MNIPFCYKKKYLLVETKEEFLYRLSQNTLKEYSLKYNNDSNYKFFGIISQDNFEIQSIPSYSRRYHFNPLITGTFIKDNNQTKLSIQVKLNIFDYIIVFVFLILCILFGFIIYTHSIEKTYLIPFIFIIPLMIFVLVNSLFAYVAKLNFCDAIDNLENIIKIAKENKKRTGDG